MEEIIGKVLDFVVNVGLDFLLFMAVFESYGLYKNYKTKKRVLQAIKEMDIEDELANYAAGCNLRCTLAIRQYFIEHGWGTPFDSAFGNLELCRLIGELRTEGKVKQLVKGGK